MRFSIPLAALLLLTLALPAAAADSGSTYTKARDAFIAGRDDEVLALLTPATVGTLRNKSHAALWAALSRARQGHRSEALDALKAYQSKYKESVFIDRIVTFYLGQAEESDVLASEREDWQRCEGGFYMGAYRLLFKGDETRAGEFLCAAFATKMTSFSEYQMSQSLLSQIKETPPCMTSTALSAVIENPGQVKGGLSTIERALAADSLGRREEAIALYRAALRDTQDHEKAGLIRSRIYALARESYDEQARAALKNEDQLSHEAGPENTVAVARFQNVSEELISASLEKGLPALVSSDLAQVKKLTVLERVELEALLRELDRSHGEAFDTTQAPRLGHLLRAGRLILGSFNKTGSNLDIESRVVNVRTGKVESRVEKKGPMRDLFVVEKDLVFALLDKLGARPTPTERNTIEKQVPTTQANAYLAYARGLDEEDRGRWQNAYDAYSSAAALDPAFRDASAAATLIGRGPVSRADVARAVRASGTTAAAAAVRHAVAASGDLVLERAFATDRLTGSGLIPNLEAGDANDRRDTRPAAVGSGTVIITGRLP